MGGLYLSGSGAVPHTLSLISLTPPPPPKLKESHLYLGSGELEGLQRSELTGPPVCLEAGRGQTPYPHYPKGNLYYPVVSRNFLELVFRHCSGRGRLLKLEALLDMHA